MKTTLIILSTILLSTSAYAIPQKIKTTCAGDCSGGSFDSKTSSCIIDCTKGGTETVGATSVDDCANKVRACWAVTAQ